jgi:hypothetical protein
MSTLAHIMDQLQSDFNQFRAEVSITNAILVHPTWQTHTHHFPATLWAYMMSGVSKLDLYSSFGMEARRENRHQNARISGSISAARSFGRLGGNSAMAHTLMHTSRPRRLRDSTGREHSYLLHWGVPELSRDDHYIVSGSNKLDFGLEQFIEDLGTLLGAYLADLNKLPELQAKAWATWPKIEVQDFRM